ncbi:MAG: hypothetical protein PHN80_13800 [Hespellia sp.]|nr:hypothetical protein [Hespellia sp.]
MKKSKSMLFFRAVVAILLVITLFAPIQNQALVLGIIVFGILGTVFLSMLPRLSLPKRIIPVIKPKKYAKSSKEPEDNIRLALLCQLSHRVTEKLHSAYPDATWDWEKRPDLDRILDGKTTRLSIFHTGEFTHAEMTMDAHGSIQLQLLRLEPLHGPSAKGAPGKEQPSETVDCSSWYELVGSSVLMNLITDLNARGYSSLSINDKGDLFIIEDGNPIVKDTLQNFPGKAYFEELAAILEENELQATANEQTLVLSWNQ